MTDFDIEHYLTEVLNAHGNRFGFSCNPSVRHDTARAIAALLTAELGFMPRYTTVGPADSSLRRKFYATRYFGPWEPVPAPAASRSPLEQVLDKEMPGWSNPLQKEH